MGKLRGVTLKTFVSLLVVCFVAAGMGAAPAYAANHADVPQVVEKTTPSVVAIIGRPSGSDKAWENNRYNLAHGTGVIVQSDGVIITNAHVVKEMNNIVVVTSEGKTYTGRTTHLDEESDLALVKIEASGLHPASFAASADIHVGDTVAAIGTPISFALRNSVTVGIVSGIDRSVNSKYQLIQTDAAINPGNSGGALINMKGEVVGINTMKYADFGVENLGFAIPVDTVQYVLKHFQLYGKVKRPYLGLELEESWEAVVGLPSTDGLRVAYVDPDSPAAQAGIKQGDQFLSIDSRNVKTIVDYNEALKNFLPGQKVAVALISGGLNVLKEVTLGEDLNTQDEWTQDSDGSYIDADRGKTRIGDSYYGWSIKYPAGLVKGNQSSDGDSVTFIDAKGEFVLMIKVESKQSNDLSPSALLNKLSGNDRYETVLERQYVKREEVSYAKIIGKSGDESYYQLRGYLHQGRIYYVSLFVNKEEHYKNLFKQNSYNDLLDSFQLSFDRNDEALKDISVYSKENHTYTNEYGLTIDLPSEWELSDYLEGSTFYSGDYSQTVGVEVTSASSGDTLKAWVEREQRRFTEAYISDYRKVSDPEELILAGVPAYKITYESSMGDEWDTRYALYFIKDKYKYEINISYSEDADEDEVDSLIDTVTSSVRVDKDDMDSVLGFIQDIDELLDGNRTVEFTNEKYKYTLHVPEIWRDSLYGGEEDREAAEFYFTGGSFSIFADPKNSLHEAVKDEESLQKENMKNDSEYKYTVSDETFFGEPGKKFTINYSTDKVPYQETIVIFRKNDITYTVNLRINEAVKTEENEKRLFKVFESMEFLNK